MLFIFLKRHHPITSSHPHHLKLCQGWPGWLAGWLAGHNPTNTFIIMWHVGTVYRTRTDQLQKWTSNITLHYSIKLQDIAQ